MVDVVVAVRQAIEVLTGQGAKAVDLGRVRGGGEAGSALPVDEAALELWEAVLMLPPEHNLALMWKVLKDNPRLGTEALQDLTCFADHHLAGSNRMGREVLLYWVRHWARKDGSSREAAFMFGRSHETHSVFYREQVRVLLDGWLCAARGALEPVLLLHEVDERVCA